MEIRFAKIPRVKNTTFIVALTRKEWILKVFRCWDGLDTVFCEKRYCFSFLLLRSRFQTSNEWLRYVLWSEARKHNVIALQMPSNKVASRSWQRKSDTPCRTRFSNTEIKLCTQDGGPELDWKRRENLNPPWTLQGVLLWKGVQMCKVTGERQFEKWRIRTNTFLKRTYLLFDSDMILFSFRFELPVITSVHKGKRQWSKTVSISILLGTLFAGKKLREKWMTESD